MHCIQGVGVSWYFSLAWYLDWMPFALYVPPFNLSLSQSAWRHDIDSGGSFLTQILLLFRQGKYCSDQHLAVLTMIMMLDWEFSGLCSVGDHYFCRNKRVSDMTPHSFSRRMECISCFRFDYLPTYNCANPPSSERVGEYSKYNRYFSLRWCVQFSLWDVSFTTYQ